MMKSPNQAAKLYQTQSCKVNSWGYQFDSLLELKYALSIRDEYEFLRSRITIFYEQGSLKPTNHLTLGIRHYTPDFLIRHKITGESFLVEIKPRITANDPRLLLRTKVAENYIAWKGYDWKFKIVFDDEIILDTETLTLSKTSAECIPTKS
ncbi:MAG: TnsA endonuclease N-terminal domain-containing protein [Agriterribacter sp.]